MASQPGSCQSVPSSDAEGVAVGDASTEPAPEIPVATGTTRCASCLRAVGRDQESVGLIGSSCLCGICAGLAQVRAALAVSSLNLAQEDEVLRALWHAYDLVRVATPPRVQRQ